MVGGAQAKTQPPGSFKDELYSLVGDLENKRHLEIFAQRNHARIVADPQRVGPEPGNLLDRKFD